MLQLSIKWLICWLVGNGGIGSFENCSLRHCDTQLYDAASRAMLQIRLSMHRPALPPCRPAALPSQAMCESKLEWKLPGLTRSLQCSAIKDVDLGGPAHSDVRLSMKPHQSCSCVSCIEHPVRRDRASKRNGRTGEVGTGLDEVIVCKAARQT